MEILLIIILFGVFALFWYHFFVKKQKASGIVKEHLPVENPEVLESTRVKKRYKYKAKKNSTK